MAVHVSVLGTLPSALKLAGDSFFLSSHTQVIDKYQVKQFYTAPTAIRSLMRSGDDWVKKHRCALKGCWPGVQPVQRPGAAVVLP